VLQQELSMAAAAAAVALPAAAVPFSRAIESITDNGFIVNATAAPPAAADTEVRYQVNRIIQQHATLCLHTLVLLCACTTTAAAGSH
jgi:hypothetical protein